MNKSKKRNRQSSSNIRRKSLKRKTMKRRNNRKTMKRRNNRKTMKRRNNRKKSLKRKTRKRRSQRGGGLEEAKKIVVPGPDKQKLESMDQNKFIDYCLKQIIDSSPDGHELYYYLRLLKNFEIHDIARSIIANDMKREYVLILNEYFIIPSSHPANALRDNWTGHEMTAIHDMILKNSVLSSIKKNDADIHEALISSRYMGTLGFDTHFLIQLFEEFNQSQINDDKERGERIKEYINKYSMLLNWGQIIHAIAGIEDDGSDGEVIHLDPYLAAAAKAVAEKQQVAEAERIAAEKAAFKIRLPDGNTLAIEGITPADTIETVKQRIYEQRGFDPEQQMLINIDLGKEMQNDQTCEGLESLQLILVG